MSSVSTMKNMGNDVPTPMDLEVILANFKTVHAQLHRACPDRYPLSDRGLLSIPWDDEQKQGLEKVIANGGSLEHPKPRRGEGSFNHGSYRTTSHATGYSFFKMRFRTLHWLASAQLHEPDERYAQMAREELESWFDEHVEYPHDTSGLNIAIKTCQPVSQGWLGTLPYFIDSEAYDDEFVQWLLGKIIENNEYTMKNVPQHGNTRLFSANCLLMSGLLLKPLARAKDWCDYGAAIISDGYHREINSDGSNLERDPHYLGVPLKAYSEAVIWAKAFPELNWKVNPQKVLNTWLYKCSTTKPNGAEACLHDSRDMWDEVSQDNGPIEKKLQARSQFIKDIQADEVEVPKSLFFPDAGQMFMRTGWSKEDGWCSFDATTYRTAHSHLNLNGLQMHHGGRTVLMDTGMLTYSMGHMKGTDTDEQMGPYGKSTRAHNTLNLNGWNQSTTQPKLTEFYNTEGYDLCYSLYDGGYYPGRLGWWYDHGRGPGLAAEHGRIFLWVQDRFALVIDRILRWNDDEYGLDSHRSPSLEINWQTPPESALEIDEKQNCAYTRFPEGGNLLFAFPQLAKGMTLKCHEGEMDPPRAWVNGKHRHVHDYVAAPQLSCEVEAWEEFDESIVSVLIPFEGDQRPQPKIELKWADRNKLRENPADEILITWEDGSVDKVSWNDSLHTMLDQVDDLRTDGSMVHQRFNPSGDRIKGAVLKGTRCAPFSDISLDQPGAFRLPC